MSNKLFPETFLWSGVSSGIKRSGRPDLGLAYSSYPSTVSGVFTSNAFPAAPVLNANDRLEGDQKFRGLVVNSGVANAATGKQGLEANQKMINCASKGLGLEPDEVLSASTGVIGEPLPLETINQGIPEAVDHLQEQPDSFSRAILTTDKTEKRCSKTILDGEATLLGIAKGSGMIRPGMATMLAFLFLDYPVEQSCLDRALTHACEKSFNRITVDGDMSTNDTVLAWAAELPDRAPVRSGTGEAEQLQQTLDSVCYELAEAIVKDGEGAEKTIRIDVKGAPSDRVARRVADSVAGSSLVKTAFHGEDPNWGRIYSSIGATTENLDSERLTIEINGHAVYKEEPVQPVQEQLDQSMKASDQVVTIDLGLGDSTDFALTCDLSAEYVKINSEYHT